MKDFPPPRTVTKNDLIKMISRQSGLPPLKGYRIIGLFKKT